jgi:hypothetical protein
MGKTKKVSSLGAVWMLHLVSLGGCQREESLPRPLPSAVEPSPAPTKPVEPPRWFVGSWQGEVQLRALPPALLIDALSRRPPTEKDKPDEPPAPMDDPVQKLSLRLNVGEQRLVSGDAQFDRAQLLVTGVVDDEVLRVTVSGADLRGTLVAERKGSDFSGPIRLSRFEQSGRKHNALAYEGDVKLSLSK